METSGPRDSVRVWAGAMGGHGLGGTPAGEGRAGRGEEGRHQRHSAHTVILPRASTRSDFLCGLPVAWGRELLEATGCNPETWYSSSAVNSEALATRITSWASPHFCNVGIVHPGSKGQSGAAYGLGR